MARSNFRLYAASALVVITLFGVAGVVAAKLIAKSGSAGTSGTATAAEVIVPVGPPAVTPTSVFVEIGSDPSAPNWAKNGRLLAFEVPRAFGTVKLFAAEVQDDGRAYVTAVAPDGTTQKQRFRLMQQPSWFGTEVLFEGQIERSAVRRLFRAPPNGGAALEVFDSTVVEGTLADVAVDSSVVGRIAFVNHTMEDGDLYLWDPRLGKAKPVDPAPGIEHSPVFTPDGNSLVFAREVAGDDDLWQVDLRKGKGTLLVGGSGDQIRPAVLPDGRILYFTSVDGRTWDIAMTNGTTSNTVAPNVKLPARAGPTFTPDGLWVAWVGTESKTNKLRFTSMKDGRLVEVEALGTSAIDEVRVAQKDGMTRVAFVAGPAGARSLYAADVSDFLVPPPVAAPAAATAGTPPP